MRDLELPFALEQRFRRREIRGLGGVEDEDGSLGGVRSTLPANGTILPLSPQGGEKHGRDQEPSTQHDDLL
jgi:hypothetical protein